MRLLDEPFNYAEKEDALMDGGKEQRPRCHKCVNEMQCSKDKDNDHKCPDYKRDAPDGGYYG